MLELRPVGGGGKDAAVASLLAGDGLDRAVYAGDDRTDLDAFRRLGELREAGELVAAVRVGVLSPEGPPELRRGVRPHRRRPGGLAGDPRVAGGVATVPYTDLLRVTVFITGAEATALGAITAIGANREGDATTILVAAAWWLISLLDRLLPGPPGARRRGHARPARPRPHRDLAAPRDPGPDRRRPALADRRSPRSSPAASASSSPASR